MRQAETALRDGRLDEAFELARADDVRSHRRGQDLVSRLVRALAARGREHLGADRLAQASADAEKAVVLGGNLPEVAELRRALEQALLAQQSRERRHANAIGAARERIHDGQLSLGEAWLRAVDGSHRAEALKGEVAARRSEVEAELARAQEAMRCDDLAAALESLGRARGAHPGHPRLIELAAQVASRLNERTRAALEQGRLDQASFLVRIGSSVRERSAESVELARALDLCTEAAGAVGAGEYRRAMEILQRMRAVLPQAAWIPEVLAQVERAAGAAESLRGGVLGMLMDAEAGPRALPIHVADTLPMPGPARGAVPAPAPRTVPVNEPPAGALPRRLMLHVDGIGSYLVIREHAVTIGGASGSRHPDIALQIDSTGGSATIERADEDYFLSGPQPIVVNNRPVGRKLLADGDRIAMSPKCHIRFNVPNAASTSAVLSIAGARMPGTDATRAILLDRSLVIGPGCSAHIRVDELPAPIILHVRDGRLFWNTDQEAMVDGRPADRNAGLPLDAQVRIGPVSMVIRAA